MAAGTVVNLVFLLASCLWLIVLVSATCRETLPETVHPGWPLRHFWVSERGRRVGIGFLVVSALGWVGVVLNGALPGDRSGAAPVLLAAGLVLAALGAAAVAYSLALYRRPSVDEPEAF